MSRDEFSQKTKQAIANRAGCQCSHPDCDAATVGPTEDPSRFFNLGSACHIAAAAPGGPRYDASMTAEQRSHAQNGIWLCRNHSKEIDDDVAKYSIDLLTTWKKEAEAKAYRNLGKATRVDTVSAEIVQVSQAKQYGTPSYAELESGEIYYSAIAFDIEVVDPRDFVSSAFVARFAILKAQAQRSVTLFELRATVYEYQELPPLAPPRLSAYPHTVYPYVLRLARPFDSKPRICVASYYCPPGGARLVDFAPLLIDDDVPQIIDVRFTAELPGIYQFALDAVIMQGVDFQTFRVLHPTSVLFEPHDEDYDPLFGR